MSSSVTLWQVCTEFLTRHRMHIVADFQVQILKGLAPKWPHRRIRGFQWSSRGFQAWKLKSKSLRYERHHQLQYAPEVEFECRQIVFNDACEKLVIFFSNTYIASHQRHQCFRKKPINLLPFWWSRFRPCLARHWKLAWSWPINSLPIAAFQTRSYAWQHHVSQWT